MAASTETPDKHPGEITSVTVLGARISWVFAGPAALGLVTLAIASRGNGWLTAFDAIFAIVVAWMLAGRWVEQRSGVATLMNGEPATVHDFRRYVAVLLSVAGTIWVAANVLGNHLLA